MFVFFFHVIFSFSPVKDTVAVNDRWGNNTRCKHGGFWDCADRFKPGKIARGKIASLNGKGPFKWS